MSLKLSWRSIFNSQPRLTPVGRPIGDTDYSSIEPRSDSGPPGTVCAPGFDCDTLSMGYIGLL